MAKKVSDQIFPLPHQLIKAKKKGFSFTAGGQYINSQYDPASEGERLLKGYNVSDSDLAVFIGLVPYYHIFSYLSAHPSREIVIIEPDSLHRESLINMLDTFQSCENFLPEMINKIKKSVINESDCMAIFSKLFCNTESAVSNSHLSPKFIISRAYPDTISAWIAEKAAQVFKKTCAETITGKYFDMIWILNNIKNIKLKHFYMLSTVKCAPERSTAVFCASGPTIHNDISKIRELSKQFPVFTVPGAWRFLSRSNVAITGIISTDGGFANQYHFEFLQNNNKQLLISPFSICSKIPRMIPKRIFFYDLPELYNAAVSILRNAPRLRAVSEVLTDSRNIIPQQGSVGISGCEILFRMGFEKIITAGLDFSVSPFSCHCTGNAAEEYYFNKTSGFSPYETLCRRFFPIDLHLGMNGTYYDDKLSFYKNAFEKFKETLNGNTHSTGSTNQGKHIVRAAEYNFDFSCIDDTGKHITERHNSSSQKNKLHYKTLDISGPAIEIPDETAEMICEKLTEGLRENNKGDNIRNTWLMNRLKNII